MITLNQALYPMDLKLLEFYQSIFDELHAVRAHILYIFGRKTVS
jgi:hypothetical protein